MMLKTGVRWPCEARAVSSMLACLLLATSLAGCATGPLFSRVGPDYRIPDAGAPSEWQAPRPASAAAQSARSGARLGAEASAAADETSEATRETRVRALVQSWARLGDPLLPSLIMSAQQVSATLAQAVSQIERARADLAAAGAYAEPVVDLQSSVQRSASVVGVVIPGLTRPVIYRTQLSLGTQASWEIDLFGSLARSRELAEARLHGTVWQWHDARISLAAEVATTYVNIRHCERQQGLARADAESRIETARLVAAAGAAGFQAPANVALARASAADGAAVLKQRETQCLLALKALVALTGLQEPELRAQLQTNLGQLPTPQMPAVPAVPAELLARRPDIAAAERDVAAASAAIGVSEAQRYPRLALSGQISPTLVKPAGASALSVVPWSIGPSVSVPLTGQVAARADVEAARAAYRAAESNYRARVRQAVREVEEALLSLRSVEERREDMRTAAAGYREALAGAQSRQRAGLGSLIELEDARRTSLAADAAEAALEHDALIAWIDLYRALGGGWDGL